MRLVPRLLILLATLAIASPALAQLDAGAAPPDPKTLVHASAAPVTITAGGHAEAAVTLTIEPKWHINANPPSPDYMIPTAVSVRPAFGVASGKVVYPTARQLKVEFDDKPLSVYTESAVVRVPLDAAATAENGAHVLKGTLRFQACNDAVCTAPQTVPITVAITVSGGAAPGAGVSAGASPAATSKTAGALDSTAMSASGATTDTSASLGAGVSPIAPPPGSESPAAKGGLVAFLSLFALGLALNLTPCVYPMLGITVSIFGTRETASTPRVIFSALVYVLGIVVMYSTLGTVAALTGQLFGAFLQNPLVLAAIGLLFIGMALSMFGLYELQPPAALMQKLGGSGATNIAGLFFSGLVVGVFAAPCVGPPVVALLGVVAQRGDAWYGFKTFFALALGLGAPYLVLGTFSNLLQKLPRSGDWMVWVKKVFGVALLAFGAFYLLNAFAPHWSGWVLPVALLLGGVYLGFVEKSGKKKPVFVRTKWGVGLASLVAAGWMFANAPKPTLEFRPYADVPVKQALASGKPVILDFSADWCIPCHALERKVFADPRVIAAASTFAAFKVDLTHTGSPDTEARTKQYGVVGIPTVVFLNANGEVRAARFSGEVSPEEFLAKLKLVAATVAAKE